MRTPGETKKLQGRGAQGGMVLVIVLLTCLGLAALALYFANSMSMELRAADNRLAACQARAAAEGGARYVAYILSQYGLNGSIPSTDDYQSEGVKVGDATFWIIGRDNNSPTTTSPVFGLVDEASKLNLNTAGASRLAMLPGVTTDFAQAILQWRSTSQSSSGSDYYSNLTPPRMAKSGRFESVEELRLVYGADLDILFGQDENLNGALDASESDNSQTVLSSVDTGSVSPGLYEYLTIYSREPSSSSSGGSRLNLNVTATQLETSLRRLLASLYGSSRASQIMSAVSGRTLNSPAALLVLGGLTEDEYLQIHQRVSGGTYTGLININTASETVLMTLPGMTQPLASSMIAYRQAHSDSLTSLAWIKGVLPEATILQIGPYITDMSYQFTADIAAVSRDGRGYCRIKFVFDTSSGTPRIVYRRDLTSLGWALGQSTRLSLAQTQGSL